MTTDPISTDFNNAKDRQFQGYSLLKEIGHGAYGTVYLASKDGTFVALKQVTCGNGQDSDELRRERRGVETIMRMPPIDGMIRIYDCGDSDDGSSFFYTMDLADDEIGAPPDGGHYVPKSLASVISAEVALPLRECVNIALRLAKSIEQLHRAHIVHRDIKPSNILYVNGNVTLADPGLIVDEREATSIVGTPGYAPPERNGSREGDIYGLGLTLYRISTGRPPNELGLPPCAEAEFDHPCFWKWMMIVSHATAKQPSLRYHSAKSLISDLRKLNGMICMARGGWLRRVGKLVMAGAVIAVLITLPVNYLKFYAWTTNDDWFRSTVDPPFPFSMLKRFYVPDDTTDDIASPSDDLRKARDDINDDINDLLMEMRSVSDSSANRSTGDNETILLTNRTDNVLRPTTGPDRDTGTELPGNMQEDESGTHGGTSN